MVDLSIIIVSYNTAKITKNCIESIIESLKHGNMGALEHGDKISYEIIVIDNASIDDSVKELENYALRTTHYKLIKNTENVGFSKANNQGVKVAQGRYILFINSDVEVEKVDFMELVFYLDKNPKVGVLTVRVDLQHNGIDPASHRGFPTLWRSFTYFSGLERVFGNISFFREIFGGYHLLKNNLGEVHEIDSPSGAFFMIKKDIFDQLKGFDEDFFMYGEDLDLAFRVKELGYKVIYYPKFKVIHLKYQSGLKKDTEVAQAIKKHFYEAMKIFYNKHYAVKNSPLLNKLIHGLINLKENIS